MPNHIKPLCSLYVMLDDLIRLCVYRGVGVHRFGYFQLHKPNKWYQSIQVSDCSSWKHGHWLFRGRHGSVESCLDPFSRNHRVADCRFEVGHFEWVQLLHTRGRWCCSLSEEGCKEEISFQPLGPCEGKKVVDCLFKTKGRFLVLSEKDKGKVLMVIKKRKEKGERQHVLPDYSAEEEAAGRCCKRIIAEPPPFDLVSVGENPSYLPIMSRCRCWRRNRGCRCSPPVAIVLPDVTAASPDAARYCSPL